MGRKGRSLIKNRLQFAQCGCFYGSWPRDVEKRVSYLDRWEWWFLWWTDKKQEHWIFHTSFLFHTEWGTSLTSHFPQPRLFCALTLDRPRLNWIITCTALSRWVKIYCVSPVSSVWSKRTQSIWFMIYAIMHNDVYVACKSCLLWFIHSILLWRVGWKITEKVLILLCWVSISRKALFLYP